jgi:hypothetical protein
VDRVCGIEEDGTLAWPLRSQCDSHHIALAWAHEADYFAFFFAIAAAISGEEAIRRSIV